MDTELTGKISYSTLLCRDWFYKVTEDTPRHNLLNCVWYRFTILPDLEEWFYVLLWRCEKRTKRKLIEKRDNRSRNPIKTNRFVPCSLKEKVFSSKLVNGVDTFFGNRRMTDLEEEICLGNTKRDLGDDTVPLTTGDGNLNLIHLWCTCKKSFYYSFMDSKTLV